MSDWVRYVSFFIVIFLCLAGQLIDDEDKSKLSFAIAIGFVASAVFFMPK